MTKQQIIDAVLECAEKLGKTPSHTEIMKNTIVSRKQIRWHFGSYARLLKECKLEGTGCGYKVELEDLFRDWAAIARDLQKVPTLAEYERVSRYSVGPLITRFGSWTQAPHGLKLLAEEKGWAAEWKDVMEMIARQGEQRRGGARSGEKRGRPDELKPRRRVRELAEADGPREENYAAGGRAARSKKEEGPQDENAIRRLLRGAGDGRATGRPVYGPLMNAGPMVCAPTNEQGVLFLFGAMAEKLGFAVLKIRTEYPDCEAFRVIEGDRLERVKIEFEYESRNFLKHLHDAKKCDMIVCWRHNWLECPLPVIALGNREIW